MRAKDGSETSFFWTGVRREIEGKLSLLGMGLDVSERKRAEERIRRVNRLKEDLLGPGSLREKMLRITDGLVYVNEACCRSLAYSREELLSLRIFDVDPNFPQTRWPEHWKELKRNGSLTFESYHVTAHGHGLTRKPTAGLECHRPQSGVLSNFQERTGRDAERQRAF